MRDYKDAKAARSAIEDRIRQKAEKDGSDISTIRRKFAFDALLERISADSTFVLKGGYAMELKNPAQALKARPTRDMDFVLKPLHPSLLTMDGDSWRIIKTVSQSPCEAISSWFFREAE